MTPADRRTLLEAAQVLEFEADALRGCHTRAPEYDWVGDDDVRSEYERWYALAVKLRAMAQVKP